jgi:hypothetical protein
MLLKRFLRHVQSLKIFDLTLGILMIQNNLQIPLINKTITTYISPFTASSGAEDEDAVKGET